LLIVCFLVAFLGIVALPATFPVLRGIGAAAAAEAPPSLPATTVPYYVAASGDVRGPLSLDILLAEIGEGTVLSWTPVWKPGLSAWIRASALPELGEALAAATPRPPTPPPQPPPPPPSDPPPEPSYFVVDGDTARGPLSKEAVAAEIAAGTVTAGTLVWQPGWADWRAAGADPAIRGLFDERPPAVPSAERMRQLMLGTWEFVSDLGEGLRVRSMLTYREDMTYAGTVTVSRNGAETTTRAVRGAWEIAAADAETLILSLVPSSGTPGSVRLRVVDPDNLVNETDGGTARRIGE